MTILPKKKSKEKQNGGPSLQQQQPQQHQNTVDLDNDNLKHHEGAAGGHSPPLELDEDHLPGYVHYTTSPSNYYERHYSSGESSPELPVLSKVRYRGNPTQKKVDSTFPGSGYNSEEEYGGSLVYFDAEKERLFEDQLKQERRFIIKRMRSDGACLFRGVADQVYGDQEMHSVVRNNCMDYMLKNSEYFSQFVTEDFEHYISRKRSDNSHGNYLEMQAIAEMYNRCIEVFQYSTEPINIFFGVYKTDNAPIRLSYHGGVHYNSVVDPYHATIGVGLGLAGHKPGVADKNLISKATNESETVYLEQSMLEDKLLHSDWDATCEAVEQAVARESYLLWLREQEKKTNGSVGESSRLPQSSHHGLSGLQPLPSSIPANTTSSLTTPSTTTIINKPLRARSRSRSSSRSQSPATVSQTVHRSLKEGRSLSSPKMSGRISGHLYRRSSPLHSSHEQDLPHLSPSQSLQHQYHHSPVRSCPASINVSPCSSPILFSRSPFNSPLPSSSAPPILCGTITNTTTNRSHDNNISCLVTPPPNYESGTVLSQTPYEYSSFMNIPPSTFGLDSWETEDDPELVAVLVASQQEYFDELKRTPSKF